MQNPDLEHLFVFVMAGGSGERFWPLSRTSKPKHLLRLLGERTLLEEALLRVRGLVPDERIFVLTNQSQAAGCREAVPWLPAGQFLAEPAKRDTAPAAALATGFARARDPQALVALFPADSMISDAAEFRKNLRDAAAFASREPALLTFGVPPTYPSTGFGYLEMGEPLADGAEGSRLRIVDRFVEKPALEVAERYLASGRHAWNAGMFLWQAEVFLAECRANQPELARFIEAFPQGDPSAYLAENFPSLPKISVDYAIMEKASRVIAVEASFPWDDVGTWNALPSHLPQDGEGNTLRGPAALVDAKNNIVVSTGRTVALCGVEGLVVVETEDAVLVCGKDAVQRVKELQPQLPEELR